MWRIKEIRAEERNKRWQKRRKVDVRDRERERDL